MKHLYSTTFSTTCQASMPTISQNMPSWSYNRPYHSLVQKTCNPICPNCSPLFDTRHSETAPSALLTLRLHSLFPYAPYEPPFTHLTCPPFSPTTLPPTRNPCQPKPQPHTQKHPFFHFFGDVMGQPLHRGIYF